MNTLRNLNTKNAIIQGTITPFCGYTKYYPAISSFKRNSVFQIDMPWMFSVVASTIVLVVVCRSQVRARERLEILIT